MTYTVIYEKGPTSWGAYVPDLPGVISVGDSREEVERLIQRSHQVSSYRHARGRHGHPPTVELRRGGRNRPRRLTRERSPSCGLIVIRGDPKFAHDALIAEVLNDATTEGRWC